MKTLPLAVVILLLINPASRAHGEGNSMYRIIVNAQNSVDSLDRRFVADIYLKKVKHWPEDGTIQPVDLRPDSATRRFFSEDVLARSVMGVKSYWQRLIFSGTDVPPPELKSEQEVIRYVSQHAESIGYVSGAALTGANGVKPVSIH
jgi:ABC-type phosphate transport system substrate-binding protein